MRLKLEKYRRRRESAFCSASLCHTDGATTYYCGPPLEGRQRALFRLGRNRQLRSTDPDPAATFRSIQVSGTHSRNKSRLSVRKIGRQAARLRFATLKELRINEHGKPVCSRVVRPTRSCRKHAGCIAESPSILVARIPASVLSRGAFGADGLWFLHEVLRRHFDRSWVCCRRHAGGGLADADRDAAAVRGSRK